MPKIPMDYKSQKAKVASMMSQSINPSSNDSIYMSITLRKKIVDGDEKVVGCISCMYPNPDMEFTDLRKFKESVGEMVSSGITQLGGKIEPKSDESQAA